MCAGRRGTDSKAVPDSAVPGWYLGFSPFGCGRSRGGLSAKLHTAADVSQLPGLLEAPLKSQGALAVDKERSTNNVLKNSIEDRGKSLKPES